MFVRLDVDLVLWAVGEENPADFIWQQQDRPRNQRAGQRLAAS